MMTSLRLKAMNEAAFVKSVNYLFTFASIFLFFGLTYLVTEEHGTSVPREERAKKIENITEEELKKHRPDNLLAVYEFQELFLNVETYYTTIETEFIGMYFVTAYSDEETYSRATASGVEVHYSEEWYEPTTCAIDPKYHRFNELILIGDPDGSETEKKIYITEDTGSAVKGLWVDCFVESMEEVHDWNTGYKPVYSVEYVTHRVSAEEGRRIHESFKHYLLYRLWGFGVPYRNDR